MNYLDVINHPNFKCANGLVHFAEKLLMEMGLTLEESRSWIAAWASGAGDGAE